MADMIPPLDTHCWLTCSHAPYHCRNVGFVSIWGKVKLPDWVLLPAGHACDLISWCTGTHLKLNAFAVRMVTIHRWFKIDAAEHDLLYTPVVGFAEGWADTAAWYKEHWLPGFRERTGQ